jgi:hypothetical protein
MTDEELKPRSVRKHKRTIDFDMWARKAYWSALEGAVLSFAQDPEKFRCMQPEEWNEIMESPQLRNRIDDIERVQTSQNKPHGLSPTDFLEWAISADVNLAEPLKEAIGRVGGTQSDWKGRYEKEQAERQKLQLQLDECRAAVGRFKQNLNQERRHSLQKMVIVMAIDKYQYAPSAERSSAAGAIHSAFVRVRDKHAHRGPPLSEIKLDQDTIHKYLQQAEAELD